MFSETVKGIFNTLQNLRFVQPSVDEIVGPPSGIKCGSEIAWYKKGLKCVVLKWLLEDVNYMLLANDSGCC